MPKCSHSSQMWNILKAMRELRADRIIIATGVHNRIPENLRPDLDQVPYLTNETAYFVPSCPESLIVLGGGYVAIEAAQMFARYGSRVTILQHSTHILSGLPEDFSVALARYMMDEGIQIHLECNVLSVEASSNDRVTVTVSKDSVVWKHTAKRLLVATGRSANTANVSQTPLSMSTSTHGGFEVTETLRTSIAGVYAAGDCVADSPQYVYTAAAEGRLAALNALASFSSREEVRIDYSVVPWVVFSSPAVAGVGLDIDSARQRGMDAEASTIPLSLLPRAVLQQDTRGFVTLLRNRQDDTIVGARILAQEAGELIMEASYCVRYKVKSHEMASMFHPYLTWNEVWKLAALGFEKDVRKLSCCAT